ncbi:MAG: hypothetical protein PHS14_15485 [Elusimicrobia bacterium]|nr:hypothetical protein [Elusimicrobiota bacterium]
MRARSSFLVLLACALLAGGRARAAAEKDDGDDLAPHFRRGRVELLAGGGYGVDNSRSYLLLALGGGYYLRDGLSAGLTGEAWLGSRPQIYNVSPYVRYVFLDSSWRRKPYAGVFYRRTSYSSLASPVDSTGVRGGLVFPLTKRAYLTAGLAFEHDFDSTTNLKSSRDVLYPEIGLDFSF